MNRSQEEKLAAIFLIETELQLAKSKFPTWHTDPIHAASVVAEEAGELVRAALRLTYENGSFHEMKREAAQVGAMAVRFLENLSVYEKRKSDQA